MTRCILFVSITLFATLTIGCGSVLERDFDPMEDGGVSGADAPCLEIWKDLEITWDAIQLFDSEWNHDTVFNSIRRYTWDLRANGDGADVVASGVYDAGKFRVVRVNATLARDVGVDATMYIYTYVEGTFFARLSGLRVKLLDGPPTTEPAATTNETPATEGEDGAELTEPEDDSAEGDSEGAEHGDPAADEGETDGDPPADGRTPQINDPSDDASTGSGTGAK